MWEQTKACQEGAEIIVATPVSIHPYPHIHPPITHTHTHKQTEACQEGAEIIVATPVSIHAYPHIHHLSDTHTHTQTDQGLSGGGRDHCGHACKYTPLPPHTPTHHTHTHTHKQTKACQEGVEIIVATPVSIHPYPKPSPYTQSDQG